MFYVYILKSKKNGAFYVGSCNDPSKRLSLHNGLMVKSTKRYAPWGIVYKESFVNLREARKRELEIKSWKKRSKVEGLVGTF